MRVAVLLSGYLRVYDNILNFINDEIRKKFDLCDIFLHITKNEKFEDKYDNLIDDDNDIKKIISKINPISVIYESNHTFTTNTIENSTINQWIKLYKLNSIKKIHEEIQNKKYDLVIRLRPDLDIKSKNIFDLKIKKNFVYLPYDSKIDKSKLQNLNDDYICDAIAFGDSEIMDRYFDVFKNLSNYIVEKSLVSETLLFNHLKKNKIKYKKIDLDYSFVLSKCNVFAICGDSGSGKSTLSDILKNYFLDSFSLECDRYHKWERNNENWKSTTHLNPNSNFIEKMKEDVFNLKIGNEIYQVDYNHKTGKFTEKKQISPSNNLIVCGLHTIYDKNINYLYDLKIFMDPQKELKHKWKISRDVIERGYNVEKVVESIRKREEDYEKYILPQKNNADLVVNFYSEKKVDILDYKIKDKLNLRLIVDIGRNVSKVKKILDEKNINFFFEKLDDKYIFEFKEFQDIGDLKFSKGDFYDYIILFIFNI
jgi:uridine kinase